MIIEDGVFWFAEGEGTVLDPFHGLEESYVSALTSRYLGFCSSISCQESIYECRNHNLDEFMIDDNLYEGKSFGHWIGSLKNFFFGKKLRASTSYKRLVKKEHNLANSQFRLAVFKFKKRLEKLFDAYFKEEIDLQKLRLDSAKEFRAVYERAFEAGRRASGVRELKQKNVKVGRKEESWFRSAVREELQYWNAFLDKLEQRDEAAKKLVKHRLEMYVQTVRFMYHSGRVSGLPDLVLLHWFPTQKKTGKMCPGCSYMVKNSPYPRDLMPTVPRAGDTSCLFRCIHKVVVRTATSSQIKERRNALPTKENMLRELQRLKGGVGKRPRKNSRAYNPWLGKSIWGLLK